MASTDSPDTKRVTIHLPNHLAPIAVSLPHNATVADLKRTLFEECPGRPKPEGQRIICSGKELVDTDTIPQTWPCVVHLAVHPGAWTETLRSSSQPDPEISETTSSALLSTTPATQLRPTSEPPLPLTLQLASLPTEFVTHVHANALRILSGQPAASWPGPSELSHARRVARTVIKYAGLGWPPVLEEELPTEIDADKGARYNSVMIDGLPYLSLASPEMAPTPAQTTALQILTYTFPLLPLMKHLPRAAPSPSRTRTVAPAQNQGPGVQVIRRFGINVRVGRGQPQAAAERAVFDDEDPRAYFPPVPEFRFQFQFQLPPSRVLLQLLFTLSRAALLLYFFAPARQPIWMACIVGWIGWEIFVVLRHGGQPRDQNQNEAGRPRPQNGEANVGDAAPPLRDAQNGQRDNQAGAVPAAINAGPNPAATLARDPNANNITNFLNRVAYMNLASESEALNRAAQSPATEAPPPEDTQQGAARATLPVSPVEGRGRNDDAAVEPSLVHRSTTFLALFLTSLVPAVWERRRARLRERERWVREMFVDGRADETALAVAAARTVSSETPVPPPSGPEVAQRRVQNLAGWRKAYVDRVVSGVAGDDGDL